ncbi:hypothetical protein [Brevibacillus massiliensis]|jgi:hypothetical protein|uniref:hypothetical protein n=1 Tax=Brevibacillus massiliensis TaxID=1118054 RepID=UPI000313A9FE|nr:hypothetical protein [Brevibacillus massiliensis]
MKLCLLVLLWGIMLIVPDPQVANARSRGYTPSLEEEYLAACAGSLTADQGKA